MDITSIGMDSKQDEPQFLHLEHPVTGVPLKDGEAAVGIWLYGINGPRMRAFEHKQNNARLSNARVRGGKIQGLTSEAAEEAELEKLAHATHSVEHLTINDALPTNASGYKLMYSEASWIRAQVVSFITDQANYLGEVPRS